MSRHLPFSLLATGVVVVVPALIVAFLPWSPGPYLGIPVCVLLSLALARGAASLWRRSTRSREVLFADLMLWGWARRVATERRLARAETLVTDADADVETRLRALERVSAMLEARDAYTRHHSLRVTRFSEAIARELGLPEEEVARVRKAAALHDVGKFFTPREVLNKPGGLTEEEFAVIKRHPGQGADLLRGVVEPEVQAMIRHHHERIGGDGYPDGLAGYAIPFGARIIAVADTFDAMTSTRAYRSARPHAKALAVLREEAGVGLDARAVAAFEAVYSGRRGTAWSSVASGMTQALTPLRELLLPAARALPALGASAAITAPVLVGGGPAVAAPDSQREQGPRVTRTAAARPVQTAAAATLARQLAPIRPARERLAADGRRTAPGPGPGTAVPGRRPTSPAGRGQSPSQGGSGGGDGPGAGPAPGPGGQQPPATVAPSDSSGPAPSAPEPQHNASEPPGGPTPAPPTAHSTPAPPAPVHTAAPPPAATSAPEVATGEIGVGPVTVPSLEVDVPDLPLPVELPGIKLPGIRLP